MKPPEDADGGRSFRDEEGGQVGGHEGEDEEGDEAGLPGELLAEPSGTDEEAADEKADDAYGAGEGEEGGEVEVQAGDGACRREETEAEADGAVVEGDEGEGEEGPEDEGVGEAGEGPLANDFGLEEDFRDEVGYAFGDGEEVEVGVFFGGEDFVEDDAESTPEAVGRGEEHGGEEELLREGEVVGFGEYG